MKFNVIDSATKHEKEADTHCNKQSCIKCEKLTEPFCVKTS